MDETPGTLLPPEPGLPGLVPAATAAIAPAYRVLARKYRPQTFDDLIGQEAMVRTLGNAFEAGRIPQAWMLTGVRGVGKTTTARILARGLNYADAAGTGPTVRMPGLGEHCAAIMESRHIDVLEMDAASHTGIDDVRQIIDGIRYAPASARYKVYIVDEVHMLSEKAFNAFLKTLEEPPPHAKFVFATTEIRKVPVTILSRCQRFDLRRVEAGALIAHLARLCGLEGVGHEEAALAAIARAAEGSVRDALSLLDQAIAHGAGQVTAEAVRDMLGLADRARIVDLFEAVMRGDVATSFAELRAQYDAGADPAVVLSDLAEFTHLVTRSKLVPDAVRGDPSLSEAEARRGAEFAERLPVRALSRAWQILLKAIPEVQAASRTLAAAEMALVRLAYAADLPTPDEVLRQLKTDPGLASAPSPASAAAAPALAAPVRAVEVPALIAVRALPPERALPERASTGPRPLPPPREPIVHAEPAAAPATPRAIVQGAVQVAAQAAMAVPAPSLQPVAAPCLRRFEDVVALADARRRIDIKIALERDVHLVRFEEGSIEFKLAPGGPRTLPNDLSRLLEEWTGRRWLITLSQEAGAPTLAQVARAAVETRRQGAAGHPLVQEVLARFPGAQIVDVRETAAEVAPEAPDAEAAPLGEDDEGSPPPWEA